MPSMIEIRCEAKDFLRLNEMCPLQGDLKRRSREQLKGLKESLIEEGLLAPFFIWKEKSEETGEELNWLLDGHARWEALKSISEDMEDSSLFHGTDFPVVYIEAGDVDEAKKALLQITSQYGSVTKEGAINFCASIPGYKAPSVAAYLKPASPIKERVIPMAELPSKEEEREDSSEVRITIAVPKAYEKAVRDLFNSVSYIRVL